MASANFDSLFVQHAMASYAKQLSFADAIEGSGSWSLDLQAGQLAFENGPSFQIGVLGSYAEAAGTWLWVWANKNMDLPSEVTKAAIAMGELGAQKAIPEFQESQIHDGETFCDRLAMIAVGESNSSAYYRAPYEGGAAYLVIRDNLPDDPERHQLARIQRVIAESISTFEMPHRPAIEAFFKAENLSVTETEPLEIMATADGGNLRIRFDEKDRLTEMKGLLTAPAKPGRSFFSRLFRKD